MQKEPFLPRSQIIITLECEQIKRELNEVLEHLY